MSKAFVHSVSPKINQCELTYIDSKPVDYTQAVRQHDAYCKLIQKCGAEVIHLSGNVEYPDSVFIEDTAVVFNEIAVLAKMGVSSRRDEVAGVEPELAKYRQIAKIESPATFEGGDVVQIGHSVFVGLSGRTNEAGFEALKFILQRYDYEVIPIEIKECLHLKSACTAISNRSLLVNPNWVDISPFADFNLITVAEEEPGAANAIRVNDTVCVHAGYPKTIQMLEELDFNVETVDISEFIKCEGGLSCLSIRFDS